MKIKKIKHAPQNSILNQNKVKFDFVETYFIMKKKEFIDLNELISLFFKLIPNWGKWLMKFVFEKEKVNNSIIDFSEVGIIWPFHIFYAESNEILLGKNTKYLDYRLSFLNTKDNNFKISICTIITANNLIGKLYLMFIKKIYQKTVLIILKKMEKLY